MLTLQDVQQAQARISPYVRITIGTMAQMVTLIEKIKEILGA